MLKFPNEFYTQLSDAINTYGISFILISILIGGILGYMCHYWFNVRPIQKALKIEKQLKEAETEDKSLIKTDIKDLLLNDRGQMNTSLIKKNRVAFNPHVDERSEARKIPVESVESSDTECEQIDPEEEEEEEQQMPQFNNRKVMKTTPRNPDSSDEERQLSGDRMTETFGKLHGKLATAQLKAKTKKMAAEMSAEEKNYEAEMKARQMESIMKLMMQNKEKFGMSNEDDIKEQLNLYNF